MLLSLPILYSAYAINTVKVLRIKITKFLKRLPQEIRTALEKQTFEKMKWINERFESLHETRNEISEYDV